MLIKEKNAELNFFREHASELSAALSVAIESACNDLEFDLQCLDWFSYAPDFFIEKKNVKAA
jgi:hypothetical protein